MKKKNREFTVFSLSALDLFCSAMGVFMILCIIVFPYYMKEEPQPEPEPPTEEPEPTPDTPPEITIAPSMTLVLKWYMGVTPVDNSNRETGDHEWSHVFCHDVDQVIRMVNKSTGKVITFSPTQPSHTGCVAQYITDSVEGGADIWLHPDLEEGTYNVFFQVNIFDLTSQYVSLSSKYGGEASMYRNDDYKLQLTVITKDGSLESEPRVISYEEFKDLAPENASERPRRVHLLDIIVDSEKNIRFEYPR